MPARFALALLAPGLLGTVTSLAAAPQTLPEEIVVTATRFPSPTLDLAGNTTRLGADRIALLNASHVLEIGTQIPGVWLSRGSGQEHLTAIRSPVLTGPGSCGSFLILEDGVATRPSGFCNVNELFELPSEQAAAVEVIRGPASALYGSNAMHGTINVVLPAPGGRELAVSAEAGPNSFYRGNIVARSTAGTSGADAGLVGGLLFDHDGGFRDASDYRQAKGFLKYATNLATGRLELAVSGNVLDQETAGFIIGEDSYRDKGKRRTNDNPESYRNANSQRLRVGWQPASNSAESGWDVRGVLRRSDMDFSAARPPGSAHRRERADERRPDGVALRHARQCAGHGRPRP